jgi:hypothetical protein
VPVGFDLGCEASGLAGVGEGGVAVTGGGVGVGEVDEEAGAGADEVGWQAGEGCGEVVDGFGCADAGEGVAAPAVEVGVAQEQEWERGVDGVGWEQGGGGVEGSSRVVGVACGGEGFAVGSGQPRVQQGCGGAVGDAAGVGELVDGGGGFVEVEEDEGLFGGGVGE